ncbi:MAG: benzoate-CoA ligase family protein [Dehalococcoidia bacterium]|nr:benzoate-CoA ligase family protein [Dehalococcoidia bacterium]
MSEPVPDNTVSVDRAPTPSVIKYSPVFNVATAMIDRHLDEGKGSYPAIINADASPGTGPAEPVTYQMLAEQVNRCGNLLRSLTPEPGSRILMVVKDCPEFFYIFWGAIKAGLIPVPLNTLLRADDYRFMIEDSECAGLVYSPEYQSEVDPALAASGHQPGFILCTEGPNGMTGLLGDYSPHLDPAPTTADTECFWLYSSGSTGRPKGAVHRHLDIVATCVHYAEDALGMIQEDVCFSAAKLFFAYGLGNAMTFPLWVGGTTVLSSQRPSPDMTFQIIEDHKPTIYFGVPTLYAAQLRTLEEGARDFSSVRCCVSAGEALPADIFRRWQEKTNTLILDGIGSTEALHIFISNTMADHRPGTSGKPVPGYRVKILNDEGKPVPPGEAGRLLVQGDSTSSRYWNNPQKTAETMADGWLNTGDTYFEDSDGYFVYCGRSDDMLKVGGIWCSPVEIENRLIEHPKVLEAAVVGRPDTDELIKPEAFVVLNQAGDASTVLADDLLRHCQERLARYKYPRWVNFVDELPKTATGKIQRFRLRGNGT